MRAHREREPWADAARFALLVVLAWLAGIAIVVVLGLARPASAPASWTLSSRGDGARPGLEQTIAGRRWTQARDIDELVAGRRWRSAPGDEWLAGRRWKAGSTAPVLAGRRWHPAEAPASPEGRRWA